MIRREIERLGKRIKENIPTQQNMDRKKTFNFIEKFQTTKDQLAEIGFTIDCSRYRINKNTFETTIYLKGPNSEKTAAMALLKQAGVKIPDQSTNLLAGYIVNGFLATKDLPPKILQKMKQINQEAVLILLETTYFKDKMHNQLKPNPPQGIGMED